MREERAAACRRNTNKIDKSRDKLERLRRARSGGVSLLEDQADDYEGDIYEEVSEKEYRRIQQAREELDDFVVNDDGEYGDDDDDDGTAGRYDSEDDMKGASAQRGSDGRRQKGKSTEDAPAQPTYRLQNMFERARTKQPRQEGERKHEVLGGVAKARKRQPDEVDEEAFMNDIFSTLDDGDPGSPATGPSMGGVPKKRRIMANPYLPPMVASLDGKRPPVTGGTPQHLVDSDRPRILPSFGGSNSSSSSSTTATTTTIATTATTAADEIKQGENIDPDFETVLETESIQLDNVPDMLDDGEQLPGLEEEASKKMTEQRRGAATINSPQRHPSALFKNETANATDWLAFANSIAGGGDGQGEATSDPSTQSQTGEDTEPAAAAVTGDTQDPTRGGDVLLYWIDAFERAGIVYIIGKVYDNSQRKYYSTCLAVHNIQRNVFVLPRKARQSDPAQAVTAEDLEREFRTIARTRFGLGQLSAARQVTRKYAFEMPGIPPETEYLKVAYPFSGTPQLPHDLAGDTFDHVFGTTYSALELLLLKRRIMGPCWLRVRGAVANSPPISWCRREYRAENPKAIAVLSSQDAEQLGLPGGGPPLTVMTCTIKTVLNHKDQANEIVAASLLFHHDFKLDDSTPIHQRRGGCEQFTAVRQLTNIPLPAGFTTKVQRYKEQNRSAGKAIEVHRTERALINYLLALIHRLDPDVVVGHNFLGFDLDILLHRMKALKVDGWSKVGRLRRTVWPKLQAGAGGMGDSTYGERQLMAGRVICDTYLVCKDLIRSKSYSLTQLALSELKIAREDLPFERIPEYFGSADDLMHFLLHTAFDAFLCCALMHKVQALPLTRQLTNLAGNLWTRTLMGARAERNEYLLLHEFYRAKYIRPDKFFGGGKKSGSTTAAPSAIRLPQRDDANEDNADENTAGGATKPALGGGRRKPAYMGGLVLEPKKGLYDHYVLLLDFNSLYPSIIQEFNICFTTVSRSTDQQSEDDAGGDAVPDPPEPGHPPGILPRLLKNLVDRRKQVKQLLKQSSLSAERVQQLDVRQKALKLTANSMYGCLGFTNSRFYAKPLAMLITAKGREILQSTKALAEGENLDVIYGDTDSIMIHSNSTSLREAYEIGNEFKKRVNERYHLLELDIDGVFRRMLLLKKKKYAALVVVNKPPPSLLGPRAATGGDADKKGDPPIETEIETKGLDLVRRDWCELSHEVSDYVLAAILSGDDLETMIDRIHSYLTKVGEEVRADRVPIEKYVINKGLTKNPEQYSDAKSQPHVLVAMRLKQRGVAVRAGDTVPYVITAPDDQKQQVMAPSASYAERAYHPDELARNPDLKVDIDWYLNQQVLPPIDRLCDPIEGINMSRLAQCLGLDPAKYRHLGSMGPASDGSGGGTDELVTLESQISDLERFKFADPFTVPCRGCGSTYSIEGIVRNPATNNGDQANGSSRPTEPALLTSGLECPSCCTSPPCGLLATQLCLQIRDHIRRYYGGWLVCDDLSCQYQSRQIHPTPGSMGRDCPNGDCNSTLHPKYSEKTLYNQLLYYRSLFHLDKSIQRLKDAAGASPSGPGAVDTARVKILFEESQEVHTKLYSVVEQYLQMSARRYVDLTSLFQFCRV
ncbi:DNA-directed DNA polymerase alpha catalytic subunit pol1 [Spiromyces aspiralis]|uniref:DNA-directed DNA polymerase alpha catalytic subunit pol1 n=1 Tax=Spiromyces aspiralis TaxID=68401 RepID=A0ACC1HUM9_9FUNG|nr:DNA-directed DNA polymerase alpha catalytic subunit pol1 [Spiromyces aspiralis]